MYLSQLVFSSFFLLADLLKKLWINLRNILWSGKSWDKEWLIGF